MVNIIKIIAKRIIFFYHKVSRKDYLEFHHFPFNDQQPLSGAAVDTLQEISSFLKIKNIKYRVTDGTVLGLYRNGMFIAHDNDLDIDVLDISDARELISSIRQELKYSIGRIVIYKGLYQQVAFYDSNNIIIDLIFWHSKGSYIYNYQEYMFERKQESKYFKDLDTIEFNSNVYPIPSKIEDWLAFRYGNSWREPKVYKGDWKEESGDVSPISRF